jgi:hypothetical protein
LRKFSSEKGSASLEILLTLDLPRATMSEDDGEPSDECDDEGGGPCAFEGGPPFPSVASVGIVVCVGLLVSDYALGPYGQPQGAEGRSKL